MKPQSIISSILYKYSILVLLLVANILFLESANTVSIDFGDYNTFKSLDSCVINKKTYEYYKEAAIKSTSIELKQASSDIERYEVYTNLFRLYEGYMYDSAHSYTRKMYNLALKIQDQSKITESKLMMAYTNLSAGLFLEAKDILESLDIESLAINEQILTYSLYAKMYSDNADYIRNNPYFDEYNELSIIYSNKLIKLLGDDSLSIDSQIASIYKCQQQYAKAIDVLKAHATKNISFDQRNLTLTYGGIGNLYLLSGDTTSAIPYLIYAAKADIKSVTKETPALSILAHVAYRQGNISRAYRYAKSSLDDANFFNARQRKIEIGYILPIIESDRFDLMEGKKNLFFIYGICVSVLVVLLIVSLFFIRRKVIQLKVARRLNLKQNKELHAINIKLEEVNKIKDEYVGQFFSTKSDLINQFDVFLKKISKKLAAKQYQDIQLTIDLMKMSEEKGKSLITFDQTFLRIFPTFIEQYNELFPPEFQIKIDKNPILPPEVRIFALIRLGVTDSDKIAQMLNYSVHTINTYKTKIKNRSIIANELFEEEIMKISVARQKKE